MKQINLKEYYPFYTTDTIVEVPDEVADILRASELVDMLIEKIFIYPNKRVEIVLKIKNDLA